MPRVRLVIDLPDLSTEPSDLLDRFADEVARAAGNEEGIRVETAGEVFTVEALGLQVLGRAQGLVLNTVSLTDYDQALHNLRDLTIEEFPGMAERGPGPATMRRVLEGVEAVYLVDEQRFATAVEAAPLCMTLLSRLR